MKTLGKSLEQYLGLRRSLGFKLLAADSLLHSFVAFMEARDADFITATLSVEWATQPTTCGPLRWDVRLGYVRHFAEFLSAFEPRTEIPSRDLLPYPAVHRNPPYLFSPIEIARLLKAAQGIRSRRGLNGATYATLFGLLAVTGMRVGEATTLDLEDLDFERLLLHVRHTKLGKSRWVPIHPTTRKALLAYRRKRDHLFPQARPHYFISERGRRLAVAHANEVLRQLCEQVEIDPRGRRISIHAFRHSFVVRTITNWYEQNEDAERRLPELSTFLGHNDPGSTYWYLSATPELLALVTAKMDRGNRRVFQ